MKSLFSVKSAQKIKFKTPKNATQHQNKLYFKKNLQILSYLKIQFLQKKIFISFSELPF